MGRNLTCPRWRQTDPAGYRLRYGNQPAGPYPNMINLETFGLTSYLVESLSGGTYYFVLAAVNSNENESENSNEAEGSIP